MARHRDPLTKHLFSWEPPSVAIGYSADVMGRGPLDNRIARAIAQALRDARDAGRSRTDVAARMSAFLRRPVSEAMLNKWAAEGSDQHRIPLDAFVALVDATGVTALVGLVPGEFGLTVIENDYADLIEAQLLEEHRDEVDARIAALATRRRARR